MGSWLEADVGSRPDVYGVSSATGGGLGREGVLMRRSRAGSAAEWGDQRGSGLEGAGHSRHPGGTQYWGLNLTLPSTPLRCP